MNNYDAIFIGSGHNNLVAAAYLAKKARKVLVLEKKPRPGGIAVTEEFLPGFCANTVVDGAGYLSPQVIRELRLAEHGLEYLPAPQHSERRGSEGPPQSKNAGINPGRSSTSADLRSASARNARVVAFCPQPDGDALTIWTDTDRTVEDIARYSKKDAEAYPRFLDLIGRIAGVVRALAGVVPPALPDIDLAGLLRMRSLAGPLRRLGRKDIAHLLRVLPMPAADLLDEWFESDALKGAIAANGVRDISWGPMESGTAYTLLYKWGLSNSGLFRSTGQVRGGMGALAEALVRAIRHFGGEIRLGAEVVEICVEGGRVTGVRLASGEVIRAGTVVSGAGPRATFLDLVDPAILDAAFVRHVRNIKHRGSTARLHLALSGLPGFAEINGGDPSVLLGGAVQIAPSIEYLQRAFDRTKYGECSDRPYLDIRIPTMADPAFAPAGLHVMSITVKYAPYHLRAGGDDIIAQGIPSGGEPKVPRSRGTPSAAETWAALRVDLVETILDTLAVHAPGIREQVLGFKLLTPVDLETEYGLPEGNLNHGEMTLDQFFHMRPIPGWADYRTPVEGLYLCGSGSHPGGGITGLPGRNAARAVINPANG